MPLDEVKELGAVFLPVVLVEVERRPLAADSTELHAQEGRQDQRLTAAHNSNAKAIMEELHRRGVTVKQTP